MSGGKGGSTTSSVQIPDWAQDAAKKNIEFGDAAAQLGYMPYYGLDVAAQTPAQQAANQNFGSAVSAFGGQAPVDMNAGMPTAQTMNGVTGYSSGGLFDSALAELEQRRPAQYQAYSDLFIDPIGDGSMSKFNQGYIQDQLVGQGYTPELASAITSGDSDSIATAAGNAGMSGDMINKLRMLPNNPIAPLGLLGMATNAMADYYAGDYGREGNPQVYGNDTFYRADGVPTPVRGSDFYSSDEAASNRSSVGVSGGGYVGSGGGNASRGFTTGGW